MANHHQSSRREFLARSAKNATTVGAGTFLVGRTANQARAAVGANDRIHVALVGCGMRGQQDLDGILNADNVVCTGLCDIAEVRQNSMKEFAAKAMEKQGHTGVQIDTTYDYQELLDRKDIDAILIVTPDHWHFQVFLDAMKAGKHVYQEKPMSYTIGQGIKMVEVGRKHPKQIVQIGTQRRSNKSHAKVKALIEEGKIGEIRHVHAFDTRNWVTHKDPYLQQSYEGKLDWDRFQEPCETKHTFDKWRYLTWRFFWDYAGGLVTDVGVHVMDIAHLITGNDTPKSAVANGGTYHMKLNHWETPDVVNVAWDYGTHSALFTSNFTNRHQHDGLTVYGTQGTIELRGRDYFVWEEGNNKTPVEKIPSQIESHQKNWIDCIRSGKRPNAPVELGFKSLLPSLLGNIAFRRGTKVTWDADAKKVI